MKIGGAAETVYINGVFEGGGVKAIALVGAIRATEERGFRFDRIAGTSSGAIVASFLAAGYTAEEMKDLIIQTPFTEFLPTSLLHRIRMIGPSLRFYLKKGIYSGDVLEQWVHSILAAKGIRTFGDLEKNKLRIIASDITRGRLLVLPEDIAHYGLDPDELEISRAVRMSSSLPFFFDPVVLAASRGQKPNYIVDGGILSNFPLWLFDQEYAQISRVSPQTVTPVLGYQLVGKNAALPKEITGPLSMVQAVISTMMGAHDERYLEKHSRFRTIKIPTLGIETTQFDLTTVQSLQLYESGLASAKKFLDRFTISAYMTHFSQYHKEWMI